MSGFAPTKRVLLSLRSEAGVRSFVLYRGWVRRDMMHFLKTDTVGVFKTFVANEDGLILWDISNVIHGLTVFLCVSFDVCVGV